ncbi:MAG TPA: SDR family oxidoreductase [Planctomycetota bacterium]|nr:SDR family oxidoreductase [Planctomycetota bacterium]
MTSASLRGRTAVVAGGGRGVGRAIADALAARGAAVAVVARSADQVRAAAAAIRDAGGTARGFSCDIASADAVDALADEVRATLGPATIVVNAAGVFGPIALIKDADPRRWAETIAINAIGPYQVCRAFLGGMLNARWGRIVNLSSAAALHPPGPLNSAYATSKVALNQLTRHLAAELVGSGVTANVIHPGEVKTEMWAAIRAEADRLGPDAQPYRDWVAMVERTGGDAPTKAADLVLRLISDGEAITGRFLWIDGGLQQPIASWGEATGAKTWSS